MKYDYYIGDAGHNSVRDTTYYQQHLDLWSLIITGLKLWLF